VAKGPQIGDPAPDFELEGTAGPFRLSEHRGERVILLFYPGDNTTVCTKQFCSYRDAGEEFAKLDAVVVGISAQSVDSHNRFQSRHNLSVPLLADVGGRVADAYGVRTPIVGTTRRAVFIVDESGAVRFRHVHALGLDFESTEELRAALDSIGAPA
jgi:peroxiredoxin Q/BCP